MSPGVPVWRWKSSSPKDTQRLGYFIGHHAQQGLVISLEGDLGAGKTCLVQGIAAGLGVPASVAVTSPTFGLVHPYYGRVTLYHLDLYRLADPSELEVLGFRDLLGPDSVTVMEWGERFAEVFPKAFLRIRIAHASARTREIEVEARGEGAPPELLRILSEAVQAGTFPPRTLASCA